MEVPLGQTVYGIDPAKPKGQKFLTAQAEFFAGAIAMLQALHPGKDGSLNAPPKWVMAIMSGRPISTR